MNNLYTLEQNLLNGYLLEVTKNITNVVCNKGKLIPNAKEFQLINLEDLKQFKTNELSEFGILKLKAFKKHYIVYYIAGVINELFYDVVNKKEPMKLPIVSGDKSLNNSCNEDLVKDIKKAVAEAKAYNKFLNTNVYPSKEINYLIKNNLITKDELEKALYTNLHNDVQEIIGNIIYILISDMQYAL